VPARDGTRSIRADAIESVNPRVCNDGVALPRLGMDPAMSLGNGASSVQYTASTGQLPVFREGLLPVTGPQKKTAQGGSSAYPRCAGMTAGREA
jgi:hypothetical protein